jgi:hypothetical protein
MNKALSQSISQGTGPSREPLLREHTVHATEALVQVLSVIAPKIE